MTKEYGEIDFIDFDKHSDDEEGFFPIIIYDPNKLSSIDLSFYNDEIYIFGFIGVNCLNSLFLIDKFKVHSSDTPQMKPSFIHYPSFSIDEPTGTLFISDKFCEKFSDQIFDKTNEYVNFSDYCYYRYEFGYDELKHLYNSNSENLKEKAIEFIQNKLKKTSKKLYELSLKLERKITLLTDQEALSKELLEKNKQIEDLKKQLKNYKNKNKKAIDLLEK